MSISWDEKAVHELWRHECRDDAGNWIRINSSSSARRPASRCEEGMLAIVENGEPSELEEPPMPAKMPRSAEDESKKGKKGKASTVPRRPRGA